MLLKAGQFETVATVGLMIGRSTATQNHVGLVYLTDTGPRFLHFAWHMRLRNDDLTEAPFGNYLWADLDIEEEENRIAVAAILDNIWYKSSDIPYAFVFDGPAFLRDGTFIRPPLGQGLTCATFVLHVLSGAGFPLIDIDTWQPREGDEEWRQQIISALEHHSDATPDHIAKMQENTTSVRVRPEDVVGANFCSPWPVAFADASEIALEVLAELHDRVQPLH